MRKLAAARPPTPHVRPAPPAARRLRGLGWLLVGTEVGGNEWVLTRLLSSDGRVDVHNRVAVWLVELVCIALGLCCVKLSTHRSAWDLRLVRRGTFRSGATAGFSPLLGHGVQSNFPLLP
jgi:hypothetical protein